MNESIDPVHKPDLKDSFTKKLREPEYLMTAFSLLVALKRRLFTQRKFKMSSQSLELNQSKC